MRSYFYHVQFNIDFAHNLSFYKELFSLLGWSKIFETAKVIGGKSDANGDIWLVDTENSDTNNYDARGMNHIAIRVGEMKDIESVKDFLSEKGIKLLFGTPKHRPEFVDSSEETYYQIMFKTEDNILFEVVYIGKNRL